MNSFGLSIDLKGRGCEYDPSYLGSEHEVRKKEGKNIDTRQDTELLVSLAFLAFLDEKKTISDGCSAFICNLKQNANCTHRNIFPWRTDDNR